MKLTTQSAWARMIACMGRMSRQQGRHQHIQPNKITEFLTFTHFAKILAHIAGFGLWIVHSNQCHFMIVCRKGHPQWGTAVDNIDSAFQPCPDHQRNSPSTKFCSQSGSAPIFDSCRAEGYTRMPLVTGTHGGRTTLRDLLRRQEVPSGTAAAAEVLLTCIFQKNVKQLN